MEKLKVSLDFGTKRFDRSANSRVHVHSAAAMLQDNYRLSSLDYGHLMDCAFRIEKNILAAEKILRLAAFNVLSHNRDDHSKNVSFLMNEHGQWTFAPAYDLNFHNHPTGITACLWLGKVKIQVKITCAN